MKNSISRRLVLVLVLTVSALSINASEPIKKKKTKTPEQQLALLEDIHSNRGGQGLEFERTLELDMVGPYLSTVRQKLESRLHSFNPQKASSQELSALAISLYNAGMKAEAAPFLFDAAERGDIQCYNLVGVELYRTGEIQKAIDFYKAYFILQNDFMSVYPPMVYNYAFLLELVSENQTDSALSNQNHENACQMARNYLDIIELETNPSKIPIPAYSPSEYIEANIRDKISYLGDKHKFIDPEDKRDDHKYERYWTPIVQGHAMKYILSR